MDRSEIILIVVLILLVIDLFVVSRRNRMTFVEEQALLDIVDTAFEKRKETDNVLIHFSENGASLSLVHNDEEATQQSTSETD